MTTHDEESRRGGLRGAVDELFGRGERTDGVEGERSDQHLQDEQPRDDTVRRDDAYAEEPGLDREPGTATQYDNTQAQYADTQSQSQFGGGQYAGDPAPESARQDAPYGDEVRGDTVTPEQVQRGGDPTAEGQFQHGGEVRGDTDLPGESRFDDPRDDVAGSTAGDVRRDDTAVAGPSTTSGQSSTGYADDMQTEPSTDRSTVGEPVSEPVSTDTHAQDVTPAAVATETVPSQQSTGTGAADLAAAHDSDDEGRAALVTADRAESYGSRWNDVKGEFVDEPRRAVADADALVGELLDELQELFKAQRADIEHSLDADETSTEDLRLALRRYRSFFDRLLSI